MTEPWKIENQDRKCGNCAFFRRTDVGQGSCYRYPPTAFPVNTPMGPGVKSFYSPVKSELTCGEHQTKAEYQQSLRPISLVSMKGDN